MHSGIGQLNISSRILQIKKQYGLVIYNDQNDKIMLMKWKSCPLNLTSEMHTYFWANGFKKAIICNTQAWNPHIPEVYIMCLKAVSLLQLLGNMALHGFFV